MAQIPTPKDPIEAVGEAYELLLEKSLEEVRKIKGKTGPALHDAIDKTAQKLSEWTELSKEEAEKFGVYLKRDLLDAAEFMSEQGAELKQWLATDMELIEDRLLDLFISAADQTTVQLLKLKGRAEAAGYHTGEVVGPGALKCDKCGELIHFHQAGRIPPCPKCKNTHYHRARG